MSSFSNITSKILNDAKEKANEIIKNAEKKANEKYENGIKKYNLEKNNLEESAKRERELAVERIKSSASLKARNEKLKAKQIVIDKVINKLKEKLINMNEDEYIIYLRNNIDFSKFNENKNRKLIVKKEYFEKVTKEFPLINVDGFEFVNSGFIIEENGIQENYTFEVKIDFMRDELEVEISKLLFS